MIKNLVIVSLITLNVSFAWYLLNRPDSAVVATSQNQPEIPPESAIPREISASSYQTGIDLTESLSGDHADLVSQLRSAGYDEDVVRGIVLATIERDHFLSQPNKGPDTYWLRSDTEPEEDTQLELTWLNLKRQQLRDIFGDEIVDDSLFESLFKPLNNSLPFLSSDKQIEIYELQRLNQAKTVALSTVGYISESRDDRNRIRQELQDQIRDSLSSEEYFEYQLRESRLARVMQYSMSTFDYTEQEFRDLFEIRLQNEGSEFNQYADRQAQRDQREVSNAQIKDYLTTERYAEYTRSLDPTFRSIQSIGDRYGITDNEIIAVYEVTTQAKTDISDLRGNEGLSPEERHDRANEIQEESFQEIENIAGKETADSVRNNYRRLGIGGRGPGRI